MMFASPVRFWFSFGLLVPAAALFGWATLTNRAVPGAEWSLTVHGTLIVTGVALLLLVLIRWGEYRGEVRGTAAETGVHEPDPGWFGPRLTIALLLLLFLLMLASDARDTFSHTPIDDFRAPLIGFTPYGFALGGVFLVIGLIIMLVSSRALRGPRPRRFVAGGVGLTVTSTLVVIVFMATMVSPVDSVLATGGTDEAATAPVPDRVDEVAWQWEAPDGGSVYQMVAAGSGAAVRHESGVTALDTVGGDEVWHFRRAGERTRDVVASPDGTLVAVTFLARGEGEGYRLRLVVLDAYTGEVRGEHQVPHHQGVSDGLNLPDGFTLTDDGTYIYTRTFRDRADNHVVAYDVDSGEKVWDFVPPEDCYLSAYKEEGARHLLGDEVAVAMQCAPVAAEHDPEYVPYPDGVHDQDLVALGLDPADGTEVWRHEEPVTAEWMSVEARAGADHGVLVFQWSDGPIDDKQVERLFLGPGGAEADRDPSVQEQYIHLPTRDGYLEQRSDEEVVDVWRAFSGEERTALSPTFSVSGGVDKSVLEDAVITVLHLFHLEDDELVTTVTVEPWDDIEDAERAEFELDLRQEENLGASSRVALLPVPGSVLLTVGTHLVLGLA